MSRSGPIQWRAQFDAEIAKAVERQTDVHNRWRSAQTEAREAVEKIAAERKADDERRSDAVAAGRADPGPRSLSELERSAAAAEDRRDVLGEAFRKARARAIEVADEREAHWTAACETAVAKASEAVSTAVAELERALAAWTEARAERRLATDATLRERGRATSPIPTVDGLRQASGESYPVPTVIAALARLTEPVESESEVEVAR